MFNMNVSTDDLVIRNTILEMIAYYKPADFVPSDDVKVSANDKEEKENAKKHTADFFQASSKHEVFKMFETEWSSRNNSCHDLLRF